MIEIDGIIVSTDILTESFLCDLSRCKGICCVEGNSGAPLEEEEVRVIEKEYSNFKDYMSEAGRQSAERSGFMVVDDDGDLTTPLIDNCKCAYCCTKDGITYCAIEKAWREGKTTFRKPVSCHLYPIRVARFGNGTIGLNYHRWNVCVPAVINGRKNSVPVYKSLREPIVRRFGEEFFRSLEAAELFVNEEKE